MAMKDLIHWVKYPFMYQKSDTKAENHNHYPIVLHFRNTFRGITDLIKSHRIVIIRLIKAVIRFVAYRYPANSPKYQDTYFILLHN